MEKEGKRRDVLSECKQLGPFPEHRLKRINKPTNLITNNIQRIDERDHALNKAFRGDYGQAVQEAAQRINTRYPISTALMDVALGLRSSDDYKVANTKAPIPENPRILSRHIKRLGYFLKADIMGICRIPQHAIYSHDIKGEPINLDYEFAIMIVVGKDYRTVKASTGSDWIIDALSFQRYQRLAFISRTVANYITRLGYPAMADHTFKRRSGGMKVMYPPLLILSGVGEISRTGIVLNPFLGIATKAAAVFTNLPLEPDKPIDFGLQDFCNHCKICAQACPSRAISAGDKVIYNGYETWKLDEQRCASFSLLNKRGTFCGKCVHVCPWTRPNNWPNNLVRWLVERSSIARKSAINFDTKLGRVKTKNEDKWWFNIEYCGGLLKSSETIKDVTENLSYKVSSK